MRTVRFTKYTSTIALVFFSIYFLYGLFRLPFLQYLVSLSIGGIVYGLTDSYELSTISLLCSHFIFSVVKKEGFTNQVPSEGPVRQIVERVQNSKRNLQGVGSPMSEGFEDADAKDHTLEDKAGDEKEEIVTMTTSKPANVKEVKKSEEEPFKNENGLFKLGEIPSDAAGGFHIDAGTTVVNALKSLNPDQITAMTKDTQQLIETQKSLMTMLKTFTPMVNEGKQMMDTFNTMFTPAMGSMKTSSDMLGGVKS